MNTSLIVIEDAKNIALSDICLKAALKDWFAHKGRLRREDINKTFDDWLYDLLVYLSDRLGEIEITPHALVMALEVNAIGDKLALYLASQKRRDGFSTDTNCYVEEGLVYSNVWLKGMYTAELKKAAEDVSKVFEDAGYAVDLFCDEIKHREITVNASIDFKILANKFGTISSEEKTWMT